MDQIFDQINAIPGIIGTFFFDSEKGVKSGAMPPVFKKENLGKIGNVLDKMYEMSRSGIKSVSDLSLFYDESTLVMRKIDETCSIVVICESSFNQNLLFMSLNMLREDLKQIPAGFDSKTADSVSDGPGPGSFASGAKEDEIINSGRVSGQLKGMQSALIKILGPMATIIFREAVHTWIQGNEPCRASIPALLDILTREINDSEKEARYMHLIFPYLEDDGNTKD